MKNLYLLKFLLCAGMALLSLSASADTWKLASAYSNSVYHTQNIRFFADLVKKKTQDKITIEVHSGGELGKGEQLFRNVSAGQLDMGELFISTLSKKSPLFSIDSLPFIAKNIDDAKKLWETSRQALSDELKKYHIVLLYAVPWPGQNLYSKDVIADQDYFKGKKMRTYNATLVKIATELASEPVSINSSDIAQAFSDNQLDIMMTSCSTGVSAKAWSFSNHYTKVNAFYPKNMVFVNQTTWDNLDEETQKAVLSAAQQAEENGWNLAKQQTEEKEKILLENGMQIDEPTKALKQTLFTLGQRLIASWISHSDDSSKAVIKAYRGY